VGGAGRSSTHPSANARLRFALCPAVHRPNANPTTTEQDGAPITIRRAVTSHRSGAVPLDPPIHGLPCRIGVQ
jgi:hypothetical protein